MASGSEASESCLENYLEVLYISFIHQFYTSVLPKAGGGTHKPLESKFCLKHTTSAEQSLQGQDLNHTCGVATTSSITLLA